MIALGWRATRLVRKSARAFAILLSWCSFAFIIAGSRFEHFMRRRGLFDDIYDQRASRMPRKLSPADELLQRRAVERRERRKSRLCATLPAAAALMLASIGACSPSVTPAMRGAYAMEAARCVASEREIEARPGTTLERDLSDLALERERCAAALATIEGSGDE